MEEQPRCYNAESTRALRFERGELSGVLDQFRWTPQEPLSSLQSITGMIHRKIETDNPMARITRVYGLLFGQS
jgi:hypothetical protein